MISPISFGLDFAVGAAAGFVAGAFTPAIERKIKALFVKDSAALKVDLAKAEAKVKVIQSQVDSKVASEAAAVAKKV